MELSNRHITALEQAEALIFHADFCPYLELVELLSDASPLGRQRFRILFTNYYGLNVGGLTEEFKERFFQILFSNKVIVDGKPDFSSILIELSSIKNKRGAYAMPFSFVSKLVSIHRESSPLYDKHVQAFFNAKPPSSQLDKTVRIEWFLNFLDSVESSYKEWGRDERVKSLLNKFKERDARLERCHLVRLMDFLVWKVGNQKLLNN